MESPSLVPRAQAAYPSSLGQCFLDGAGARGDDPDRPTDVRDILLLVIDAEGLANRSQELRHRYWALRDRCAVGAGVADDLATFDAAAGQHRAERVRPMVA